MVDARRPRNAVLLVALLVTLPLAGCLESAPPPQLPRTTERTPLPPESASGRTAFFRLHLVGTSDAPSKLGDFESVNLVIHSASLTRSGGKSRIDIPLGTGARADLVAASTSGRVVLVTQEVPADTYTGVTLKLSLASAYGKDGRPKALDIAPDGLYYADNRTGQKTFTLRPDSTLNFNFGLHVAAGNGVDFLQTRIDISGVSP